MFMPQTMITNNSNANTGNIMYSSQPHWSTSNNFDQYPLRVEYQTPFNTFFNTSSGNTSSWPYTDVCAAAPRVIQSSVEPVLTQLVPHACSSESTISGNNPFKRKLCDTRCEESLPNKIFVTEEMASRMNEMHISNNYTKPLINNSHPNDDNVMDEDIIEPTNENCSYPRLIVSDQLKNIHSSLEMAIPESLVTVENPTTALVLWRPLSISRREDCEDTKKSSVIITDVTDHPDPNNYFSNISSDSSSMNIDIEYPD